MKKSLLFLILLAGLVSAQEPARMEYGRGLKLPSEAVKRHGGRMRLLPKALPASYDGREFGWVPPVRDQGQCGSCYLVSSCDVASMAFIRAGYGRNDGSFSLASQYGMDCYKLGGC